MAYSVASEKAGRDRGDGRGVDHAQDRFLEGGGARLDLVIVALAVWLELGLHAGRSWSSFCMGPPQHGQEARRGGFSGAATAGPMSRGRPVWKAMRSRLALAAGWQKPW